MSAIYASTAHARPPAPGGGLRMGKSGWSVNCGEMAAEGMYSLPESEWQKEGGGAHIHMCAFLKNDTASYIMIKDKCENIKDMNG